MMKSMSAAVLKTMFSASLPKGVSKARQIGSLFVMVLALAAIAHPAHAAPKYAGIVVDAKSGKVLYGEDPDGLRYPASLTKMMTLYLTFEALEAGRISLESKVPVSSFAAKEPPSKLYVKAGGSVTVDQAIRALVTRSANDVATALGEFLGGSETRFARTMTAKAQALGMTRTTYRNAHGLPNTAQMTTARDQARLSIALRQHFPQYYHYFSIRSFRYGKVTIGSHNRLVGSVKGVDGIKTGYTRAAGSNLATSAELDGHSIVAVVLGGRSSAARDATMRKLVAQYLPKATRGGRTNLIASRGPVADSAVPVPRQPTVAAEVSESREVAAFDLPNSGPLPDARYEQQQREPRPTAPLAVPKIAAASAYAGETSQRRSADQALSAAMTPPAAIPSPAPEYMPKREEASIRRDAPAPTVDEVTTASTRSSASTPAMSGWVIQIGVSPNEKMANDLLQSAQDKGGKVLRSAKPFTVAFSNNGEQIYRARFGGFDDQKAAVNACNALKKKGVGCWASMQ
jgi:D-alanyl-D-alanine carboxypeptidase